MRREISLSIGICDSYGRGDGIETLSVEMECSAIFMVAGLRKLEAGADLAVDGNLVKGTRKGEFEQGERTGELVERVKGAIRTRSESRSRP